MRKKKMQKISSPDEVREDVLKFLYDKYKKSRSVKKQSSTISEIKRGLKSKGYKPQEIAGAISFLIDRGWIKEIKEKKKFFIKDRLTETEQIKYRISDVGISHFEGPSKFASQNKFSGINITNIQGVTVVGSNNIVRNEYLNLYSLLDKLGDRVRSSNKISDQEKMDLQSDIETIKNQLGKSEPNKNIIKTAWESIEEKLKKFSEFVEPISKIATIIKMFTE